METTEALFKYSVTYGLGIVLSVGMALFLFWILQYVLKENSKREDKLAAIIEGQLKYLMEAVSKLTERMTSHDAWEHEIVREENKAHEHQKNEHEEILRRVT